MASPLPADLLTRKWSARLVEREREVRDTLCLLGAVAFVLLPMLGVIPDWASGAIVLLIAWRAWLTLSGRRLPVRWLLIALMAACGTGVLVQFHTIFGKDAGVTFVVLLLCLKLLELRARRDIFVAIYLSLFIMLTTLFESQSPVRALWLFCGVLGLVYAMVRVNYAAAEPSARAKIVLASKICFLAVPLMIVLFVLFPRVEGPLWGMPADAQSAHMGLSDTMQPGSFSHLIESGETAFTVEFQNRVPAPEQRYWRGPVLEFYDGHTWHSLHPRGSGTPNTAPEIIAETGSAFVYRVTLGPTARPIVTLLEAPLEAPPSPQLGATLLPDLEIVVHGPLRERTEFEARSQPTFRYGVREAPRRLAEDTLLPPGNPRTRALAAQWLASSPQPDQLVARALRWLHDEKFYYTTEPPLLTSANGIDEFLFDSRRGFCEHYAGSFTYLMRAAGIPARVVTGYQGGDINPVDGVMTLRQSDAHAWVEVWMPDRGWVRADPTAAVAPERIEHGFEQGFEGSQGLTGALRVTGRGWMRYLQYHLDALNADWNRWVVSYSSDAQHTMLKNWGIPDVDWQSLTIALMASFALVAAILARQILVSRPRVEPAQALYLRLCEQLGKRGIKRHPNEGPRDYLQRVRPGLDDISRSTADRAFELYESLRYARAGEGHAALLDGLRACVNSLKL